MAKRRRHNTGSVYRVRKVKGLGQLDDPKSWMGAAGPTLIGGAATALTVVGIRHLVTPTSEMQRKMQAYSPWIGLGVGLLSSFAMSLLAGQPAAVAGASGSIIVSGSMLLQEALVRRKVATVAPAAAPALAPYGLGNVGRFGAVVFEPTSARGYGSGGPGTGAIVPERGPDYGDQVNLQGIGPEAFGSPGF